jgi:hypothetical protein
MRAATRGLQVIAIVAVSGLATLVAAVTALAGGAPGPWPR